MRKLEEITQEILRVSRYVLPLLSIIVLVCNHFGVKAGFLIYLLKEIFERTVTIMKDDVKDYEKAKLEFMDYFLKGRIPPSAVLNKLKLDETWIDIRLYAVPEGKAKYLKEGGMFYDNPECRKCFTGKHDKNKTREENRKEFQYSHQSFDSFHYKKSFIKTVQAMETFIEEGGNRNKPTTTKKVKTRPRHLNDEKKRSKTPRTKRSKTPKRLKDD